MADKKQPIDESSLIPSLKEDVSYLTQVYNERLQKERYQKEKQVDAQPAKKSTVTRGGIYVPPHKLKQLEAELMQNQSDMEHQKLMWELLRKSINGIINKVNIANIQNVVIELLNENILRGKGLLARSVIKAQMASPNFTHVYAALIAVINTKLPEIVHLIIRRVLLQFQRSYHRNNKLVCMATTKMIAHLINQRVLTEYVGLQMLMIMLETPTADSVEIACDFMIEVGQVLTEVTPGGTNAIFNTFKDLLHEGYLPAKVQYSIESLFAVRKTGFKDHPGIIPELDLVELYDQFTHQFDLDEQIDGYDRLNVFKYDPFFEKTYQSWYGIKRDILGEENIMQLGYFRQYEDYMDYPEEYNNAIQDLTEKDMVNLRKTIYLTLQSTVDFYECAHKIMKMGIAKNHEWVLCDMIVEYCMMDRIYQKFNGLLAQRFCELDEVYKENFIKAFVQYYHSIFKHETNKIRNLAKFFGHLFYTHAIDWKIFEIVQLTPEATTAASRTFLKLLLRDMAENMGIERLHAYFNNPEMKQYFYGLFPMDHPNNVRFAINYYTTIGLGRLSDELREVLAEQEKEAIEAQEKEEQAALYRYMEQQKIEAQQENKRYVYEDSPYESSYSSSDSSSDSSDSSSSEERQPKRRAQKSRSRSRSREPPKRRSSRDKERNQRRSPRKGERSSPVRHARSPPQRRRRDSRSRSPPPRPRRG